MKRIIIVLLLILTAFSVFAAKYEIVDYSFSITGKTDPAELSRIVGSTGSVFDSIDELEEFLDEKKQDLINLRLFSDVVYHYTVSNNVSKGIYAVEVSFMIWDAKSFFIIPYPKYDSNYGFKLGVKMYNKNLGGKLTNFYGYFGFSQQENQFKKGQFDWEFSVKDIKVGKATLSASTSGGIDLLKWDNTGFSFSTGIYHISIRDFDMSASAGLSIAPLGSAKDSPWGLSELTGSLSFRFDNEKMNNPSFSTTLTQNLLTYEFDTSSQYSCNLQYGGIYSLTALNTEQIDKPDEVNKGLDFIEIGSGIGRDFPLFDYLKLNMQLMFYIQYDYNAEIVVPYFDLSFISSKSDIDWVGNLRKGFSYDLRMDLLSYPINETDRNSFRLWLSASGFYPLTSWFNPSMRVSMTTSDRLQYFAFNDKAEIADYIRGVRLNNALVNTKTVPMHTNAIAINLDFMLQFITIRNFCKSYITPFVDVLIVNEESADPGFDSIVTVGGEGIIILDDFPGYPIRGSLGINANDLFDFMKGEKDLSGVEYEIYIGMGFLY